LLIIERLTEQQLVLIIVAAGTGLTAGVAVDLDLQRLPQDHLSFVEHWSPWWSRRWWRVIWLCQRPPVAQSPLLASTTSSTCGALRLGDVKRS
jgi:hypothetical protein